MAQLCDVSKIYGSGEAEVKALDGLDLEVFQGDYLAVMGASGSGKSTAMNVLGCLDRPTSGSYRLNGTAVEQLDDDALLAAHVGESRARKHAVCARLECVHRRSHFTS